MSSIFSMPLQLSNGKWLSMQQETRLLYVSGFPLSCADHRALCVTKQLWSHQPNGKRPDPYSVVGTHVCCTQRMVWSLSNFCDDDPLNAHALVLWLAITATKEVLSWSNDSCFATICLQVASSTISWFVYPIGHNFQLTIDITKDPVILSMVCITWQHSQSSALRASSPLVAI
jgi:hypothetical protein